LPLCVALHFHFRLLSPFLHNCALLTILKLLTILWLLSY
jgi:hypothetical protein